MNIAPRLLKALRFILWWAALAAAAGFLALLLDKISAPAKTASPAAPAALSPVPGFTMKDFLLTGDDGRPFTLKDVEGKAVLMFFGFTHCPMICPTELADMARWLEALGADRDRIRGLFVTVDPERDTVLALNSYMKSFEGVKGLTGTPEQLAQMAKDYAFYYKKMPLPGGGYNMDHSASTWLFDRHHVFVGQIDAEDNDESALKKIRATLASP